MPESGIQVTSHAKLLISLHGHFQYLPHALMEDEVGAGVLRCRVLIDDDESIAAEIGDEACRRINDEARTADDEHIGLGDLIDCLIDIIRIKRFFIEHDVRLDHAAATGTVRHGRCQSKEGLCIICRKAFLAGIRQDGAVDLDDIPAPRALMETIDVLRDDGREPALLLAQSARGSERPLTWLLRTAYTW